MGGRAVYCHCIQTTAGRFPLVVESSSLPVAGFDVGQTGKAGEVSTTFKSWEASEPGRMGRGSSPQLDLGRDWLVLNEHVKRLNSTDINEHLAVLELWLSLVAR